MAPPVYLHQTLLLRALLLAGLAQPLLASVVPVGGPATGPGEGGWVFHVYTTWQQPPVHVGDQLLFEWAPGDGHIHDVWQLPDKASFDACDFSSATFLANSTYTTAPLASAGTYYYACSIGKGRHCQNDQKVAVEVL